MEINHKNTIMLIAVLAALIVSGCSGSTGDVPSPTPGVDNGSNGISIEPVTATPVVSDSSHEAKASTLTVASQMYSLEEVHWFEYLGNASGDSFNMPMRLRTEYGDEIYRGIAATHVRTIMNSSLIFTDGTAAADPGRGSTGDLISYPPLDESDFIIDIYTSRMNNSTLGVHMMMSTLGHVFEQDIPESELKNATEIGVENADWSKSDASLTYCGQDTITVEGRAYDCARYTFTEDDVPCTVWYSTEAPVPVKLTYIVRTDSMSAYCTLELQGWG